MQVCVCVCSCIVYVSEQICCWKQTRSCEISPHFPLTCSGGPVALGSASLRASWLRLVWLPVCKHSIHRWYERLSEMWWLSSEVRPGDCCHLGGQRWDWLRDGEIQRGLFDLIIIQIESTWQTGENNNCSTWQPMLTQIRDIQLLFPSTSKGNAMIHFSSLPADPEEHSPVLTNLSLQTTLRLVWGQCCLSRAEMPLSSCPISQV